MKKSRLISLFFALLIPASGQAATCLWVSSYAPNYEWNDGIGRALHSGLAGQCDLLEFHLDTKRNRSSEFAQAQAKKALAYIQQTKPDLIIASDDNASKYLVKPYLKDGSIPVVFCGINWSVKEYGYPYKNATGMIEVAPVQPLINEAKKVLQNPKKALYLTSDVKSSRKDFKQFARLFSLAGIQLKGRFAETMQEWKRGFKDAQNYDFIIIGSNGGINDWQRDSVLSFVQQQSTKFSLAFHNWMAPFAMVTFNKIAEEQGEWAATVAIEILNGADPQQIPISPNRRWKIYANPQLLAKNDYQLSPRTQRNAINITPETHAD
ncbi:MAG: ABC transporter substrate binding protein [Gammaproteobacteria bacterium]|nr:ABC transporter substrate binding protein [Gammaproteobacteria bacterium]